MRALQSYISGFSYSIQLIIRKNLYVYFLPAIGVSIVFYMLFSGGQSIGESLSFMEEWDYVGWIFTKSKSVISVLSFMLFEFFVLVLLSPVNAYLAERTREDLIGDTVDFSWAIFIKSLRRMLVILIVGFVVQLSLMLVLWIFSFLFGDFFYEIASMLNLAFFVGFSFFDFSLELDEINSSKSWKYARKNWIACILIGLTFNMGIYYPQMHGLIWVYLFAISILPNLLSIVSSKMYYDKTRDLTPTK